MGTSSRFSTKRDAIVRDVVFDQRSVAFVAMLRWVRESYRKSGVIQQGVC
jgi:hypothetical protein